MNTRNTDYPVATTYVSNDMAVWLDRGETLGRLWNTWRGRFEH
ncbi:MAG: hypothetical protein WEC99_00710 [Halofilum sp. (in: g-proteobacteria)]